MVVAVALAACAAEEDAAAPEVANVYPSAVCRHASEYRTWVEIDGANFAPTQAGKPEAGARVRFIADNTLLTPPATTLSSSWLLVAFPVDAGPASHEPPKTYDVEVTNPDGQQAVLPDALTHYAPFSFARVSPDSGAAGATVTLQISGLGLYGPLRLRLGSRAIDTTVDVVVNSAESATATLRISSTLPPGTYGVTLENEGGCTSTIDNVFEVL